MGFVNFIKQVRQRWKLSKLEKIEDKIWNNLVLLSQGKITLASCIASLAYFTEKQISQANKLRNYSEDTTRYLICFYVKYLKFCLDNEYNLSFYKEQGIVKWVAIYIYKNDNSLREKTLEEYEKNLSKYYKDIDTNDPTTKSGLRSSISVTIYNTYPASINLKTEKSLENIKKLISINADNFDHIVSKTDSSKLWANIPESCKNSDNLGEWWFS